jgi:hypothetical protein
MLPLAYFELIRRANEKSPDASKSLASEQLVTLTGRFYNHSQKMKTAVAAINL